MSVPELNWFFQMLECIGHLILLTLLIDERLFTSLTLSISTLHKCLLNHPWANIQPSIFTQLAPAQLSPFPPAMDKRNQVANVTFVKGWGPTRLGFGSSWAMGTFPTTDH
jgi:hypothetical protein